MKTNEFFDEQTERSEIKTEIVRKYFWSWAKIMLASARKHQVNNNKIAYVDLFAGSGRYNDGSKSTPVLILERAIDEAEFAQTLVTIFNDENRDHVAKLKTEINTIDRIGSLKYKPLVTNFSVDDDLVDKIERSTTIPTLYFLDPCGYKGLSLRLVKAVIQPWGCDCMFFFNYNRINAALSNPVMMNNMNAFFGEARAKKLRSEIEGKIPQQRENLIINRLKEALAEFGGTYSIEYFFKDANGSKTSHFLIFVSKNVLGYNIMKSIMAKESSEKIDGVASFGFNPKDQKKREELEKAPLLFDMFESPLSDLTAELLESFHGQTLTVTEIFRSHHVGKEFVLKNYQDALRDLEESGKIIVNPPATERRKVNGMVTFGEIVTVTFPKKGD